MTLTKEARDELRRMKQVDSDDYSVVLSKAETKIKVMNQILNRMVPSDDAHTFILER